MNNTESRKQFELFFSMPIDVYFCDYEQCYKRVINATTTTSPYPQYNEVWRVWRTAWQASRAKPIVLPMPWIEEVEPDVLEMRTICKAAIEAAGYKCE